ncbi:MAG TPA: hypothetical protein VGG16_08325 [Streptosporangiaceae bacterium]
MPESAGPLAGEPRERRPERRLSPAARAGSWLTWWVLLMSLWIMLDDSVATDELLAGAGVAVLAATFAELISYQAATRFRPRFEWLAATMRLPGQVAGDMVILYRALWRALAHGEQPASGFVTEPVRFGDDTAEGATRRALLIGARSLAPNAFALGIDSGTDTMVLHELVQRKRGS